jgi:hypothetical protein
MLRTGHTYGEWLKERKNRSALLVLFVHHVSHTICCSYITIAVTCGERSEVFCFKCGDFVCHEIVNQERERIDISRQLPWMGWHDHPCSDRLIQCSLSKRRSMVSCGVD